jgi:hypothetical protein
LDQLLLLAAEGRARFFLEGGGAFTHGRGCRRWWRGSDGGYH